MIWKGEEALIWNVQCEMTPGENVLKTGAHCTVTPDDRRHMGTTTDNQRRSTERARIGLVRIGQATCKDSRKQDSLKKGDDGYSKDKLFMTQLLLLGKFEYTGGPIFKVVLEC